MKKTLKNKNQAWKVSGFNTKKIHKAKKERNYHEESGEKTVIKCNKNGGQNKDGTIKDLGDTNAIENK